MTYVKTDNVMNRDSPLYKKYN